MLNMQRFRTYLLEKIKHSDGIFIKLHLFHDIYGAKVPTWVSHKSAPIFTEAILDQEP